DQALEIGIPGDRGLELGEIGRHLIERLRLFGQFIQRGRIATGKSGQDGSLRSHDGEPFLGEFGLRAGSRQALETLDETNDLRAREAPPAKAADCYHSE